MGTLSGESSLNDPALRTSPEPVGPGKADTCVYAGGWAWIRAVCNVGGRPAQLLTSCSEKLSRKCLRAGCLPAHRRLHYFTETPPPVFGVL